MTTRRTHLTPKGIARILARGIRANYAPENQDVEIDKLVEYLTDLAMSRDADASNAKNHVEARQAEEDAYWLDAIAANLE